MIPQANIEDVLFHLANFLRLPVFVAAILALIFMLFELGSFVFELLRSIAVDIMPGYWQMTLGTALLLTILFLPEGLGSIVSRLRWRHGGAPLTQSREGTPPEIDASGTAPAVVLPAEPAGKRAAENVS